jgi:hypothetical protein
VHSAQALTWDLEIAVFEWLRSCRCEKEDLSQTFDKQIKFSKYSHQGSTPKLSAVVHERAPHGTDTEWKNLGARCLSFAQSESRD